MNPNPNNEELRTLIGGLSVESKQRLFRMLRNEHQIHALEDEFFTSAEMILEAISRSGDLTKRGVRGILAECVFVLQVLPTLHGWTIVETPDADSPYDVVLQQGTVQARIQVKMQRLEKGQPLRKTSFPPETYVVEVQKTRTGKDNTGKNTRPYYFTDFDILAVSLGPSTHDWTDFRYSLSANLLARDGEPEQIQIFQPVHIQENANWTANLQTCLEWHQQRILPPNA